MAGPPMKSRLLAAGLEWNSLTPVWDKDIASAPQRHSSAKPSGSMRELSGTSPTYICGACAQDKPGGRAGALEVSGHSETLR